MRAIAAIKRAGRWVRGSALGSAVILCYHRVANVGGDVQMLAVSPERFAEHLAILRARYVPRSLNEVVEEIADGRVRPRSVVVTFDDGYLDNLVHAKPQLRDWGMPAVVFVTAGFVDTNREFYWDGLARLLLGPRGLPRLLRLSLNGAVRQWDLGSEGEQAVARPERWNVMSSGPTSRRHQIYRELCDALCALPDDQRMLAMEDLTRWAGTGSAWGNESRVVSAEELRRLAEGGLVEIGAHTMTHPLLANLPPQSQAWEIQQSKQRLERALDRPVHHLAYPYGSPGAFTAENMALASAAGFRSGCSTLPRTVWRGSDVMNLPRFLVRDWDGDEFERRLRWFFRS